MTEKYVGYSLLVTGILLMVFAVIQIIMVFTGKAEPIQVFQYEEAQQEEVQEPLDQEALMRQLQSGNLSGLADLGMSSGLSGFGIDAESINKMINLTVYYFIMQFVLSLGFKLSSLGVQMVRPMNVTVQRNKIAEMIDNDSTQQTPV